MEYVDDYLQVYREYILSPRQWLHFLDNLIREDAKRYYLDNTDGYAINFHQAIQMLEEECNYPVRQTRVKNYLHSLPITALIAEGK